MKEPNHQYLASLVIQTQHGNNNAFAELYALTYGKVYNYARHYMKDDFLAQDAVQEVYISVLKNINKINDPTLFIAWLNQIGFHVCYDMCKKTNQEYGVSDPEIFEIIKDEHIYSNPEAHLQKKDERSRLQEAISILPLNEQQVIIMRYYNNMKINDIADATGFSLSSVKRYLASGQDKLKQVMSR